MKVKEVCEKLGLNVHVQGDLDKEVHQGVVGDLLSFIMRTAPEGAVWVTIQNHVNVAAVAVLKDIPFIVLASGREPLQELIDSCRKENITLTSSKQDAFNLCGKLYELGIKD
ncbi:MAG: serine kinase [Acetomicrobium sp.]|uniref:serine kinase n=1 Tax=Acetomicrobium sp. TaxID=1872099 RepID=UPI001BCA7604|nr:serine kinase [Acetomicrobium sp.]